MEKKSPHWNPKIAIIGLGYVGLPLAIAFGQKYQVVGFDINESRVSALKKGEDETLQTTPAEISATPHLVFSSQIENIKDCEVFIVTVPTPVDENKIPDLKPLLKASAMLGGILKKGDYVIYESTVYPGCTEEDCVPVLTNTSGLNYNTDFFVGYSPERINPGDKINTLTKIIKVTSGSTMEVANQIDQLYGSIIEAGTHKASSIKVAEASKAIENAQRDINISFVNELALIFDKMNIDTHEVLAAAATKWNFLPFKPGLVGGHCIGVDPYYLAHKATQLGHTPQVILSGRKVNDTMSGFITDKLVRLMEKANLSAAGARILLLGVTFKENCPDIRNSKVFDIYHKLINRGFEVAIFDPFADAKEVFELHGIELITDLKTYDAILITVAHSFFASLHYDQLKKSPNTVLFDTKAMLDKKIVTARL
jgi:UDP-N-acetyl-D-galactosamine dehydrogenase